MDGLTLLSYQFVVFLGADLEADIVPFLVADVANGSQCCAYGGRGGLGSSKAWEVWVGWWW